MGDIEEGSQEEAKGRTKNEPLLEKEQDLPKQFGGDVETPDTQETLAFWRSVNCKDVSDVTDGWLTSQSRMSSRENERRSREGGEDMVIHCG